MDTPEHAQDYERLLDLVTAAGGLKGVLDGMTWLAAASLTRVSGTRIECAVTLRRPKRCTTVAGSSDDAVLLAEVEQGMSHGPCREALRTARPVLLADVATDLRWPEYRQELASKGCRSALGVPLVLGEEATAVLNFFAPATGLFTGPLIAEAEIFAGMASRALRLALRIAAAELHAQDLNAAMEHRTAIDLARGILMAQNRCSQEEAIGILKRASNNRNQKLREVADDIISRLPGTGVPPHFEA